MTKTHNVVVKKFGSPPNSFDRHSTQSIQAFIRDLEPAAARLETDKSGGALLAIVATLRFLQTLPARPHLWAPFEEAVDLIAKTIDPKMISKKTEDRVVKSIAVSLQRENKISLRDALKNIVGRDPVASKKLEDFRNYAGEEHPKGGQGSLPRNTPFFFQ